ncbi:cyclic diguanylate phosphodiesterase (EAL) domain protein [Bordetella bronchiseptica E014]|nr:LapD/MoxY N-terminal periplasmic domain-containing protein [Bordetella bronchiseptica]AUL14427.1 GGDEF domain-containing protein [Bordetella bronchiseptica]AWP57517.1 GGDEF domain-containing protein [Bordetella bronchiseptica]AWQ04259.1 GGDEF domain-containing protein [Bordetella bronchiseptica]KAK71811.1 cyclic diguanylate phosphodiesterase (EAL) domain protein [Bordetella bronchiseptica MO211]KAK77131.1 cyclic diguanylate phosphodiesterase (EAL) domain protein [Bordetella bronchiseptica C
MSILRRLLLSLTLAIGIILLGTLVLSINAARGYLSDQLQVQSTDAAVSLALSLSQPANNDPVTQELLVSALFDGGHFSLVRLADPQGAVMVERGAQPAASVPAWFQALAPLANRAASHAVSDGWRQIGEVTLVANDAYAWETLWASSLRMAALIMGAGVLWALFAFALVRWIEKRLLFQVSEQVRAIDGRASGEQAFARVAEFSGIVDALAQTRERVRATAEEQSSRIESLEVELNQDPVTGLANRKYFINEFRRALDEKPADSPALPARLSSAGGHVLVFRQRDLTALNRHMPRQFIDQWLQSVCQRISALVTAQGLAQSLVARLNGSDFAVLLPHCAAPQAQVIADLVRAELRTLRIPVGEGGLCRWAMALADYAPGTQFNGVLARLDFGLTRAESAGDDHAVLVGPDNADPFSTTGQSAWMDALVTALDQQRFSLSFEPLHAVDGRLVRMEAMLMLHNDDAREPIPAMLFIPAAVRLNLSAECDLQAVRLALDWLAAQPGELAVRLSLPSLGKRSFLRQLELMLADRRAQVGRLYLEVDAHGLVDREGDVIALERIAAHFGAHVGLRRLAQQFGAMSRLHSLPLAYVKLGGGFVGGMSQSPGSRQLAGSVIDTARALNIEVYAEDVPDAATRDILARMGVEVMRGPGVTPPPAQE